MRDGQFYWLFCIMTSVTFRDDDEDIIVCWVVDLDTWEEWWLAEKLFLEEWDFKKERQLFNRLRVKVYQPDEKERESMMNSYRTIMSKYLPSSIIEILKPQLYSEWDIIYVPIKIYMMTELWWKIRLALDTLWSSVYNPKNILHYAYQDVLLNNYTDYYMTLLCKSNVEKHYRFCPDIYKMLKKKFWYLENSRYQLTPEKDVLAWKWDDPHVPELREFLHCIEILDGLEDKNTWKLNLQYWNFDLIKSIVDAKAYQFLYCEYEWHHNILDYILFSLIFENKVPLILITRWVDNVELWAWYKICITDEKGLNYFIKNWEDFLIINPFQDILNEENREEWQIEIVEEIRKNYKTIEDTNDSMEIKMKKIRSYMMTCYDMYEKVDFVITSEKHQPKYIQTIVEQMDKNKFNETASSFKTPPEVNIKPLPKWKEKRIYKSKQSIDTIELE